MMVEQQTLELCRYRLQDADYGDMFDPSEEQCRQAVEQAGEFVRRIRDHFENRGDE